MTTTAKTDTFEYLVVEDGFACRVCEEVSEDSEKAFWCFKECQATLHEELLSAACVGGLQEFAESKGVDADCIDMSGPIEGEWDGFAVFALRKCGTDTKRFFKITITEFEED